MFQSSKIILFLFISCLFITEYAFADYDLTKLKDYSFSLERTPPAPPPFLALYKKDGRQLSYIATNHGSDRNSPTFNLIKNTVNEFKPDFMILEGFETKRGVSPSDIIKLVEKGCEQNPDQCEEPHLGIELASSLNIPFIGGEPSDEEIFDDLRYEGYSRDDVFALYFTRLIPQLYRDHQVGKMEDLQQKYEAYLQGSGISNITLTYADYEDWLKKYISSTVGFSDLIDAKFSAPATGGNKLQQIADKTEWIRDKHILRTILDSSLKYNKVLVIYGHSHFLTQDDVLEQNLGKPTFLEKYSAQN